MSIEHLAVSGGEPEFPEPLHVGRPNVGDREILRSRIDQIIDRLWFTNHGPVVKELETTLESMLGVEHVIAVCNGTLGLEIALRASDVQGEVIVPSFTFVATAHAVQWQGLKPVFADVGPGSHHISPESVSSLVTPSTTAIIGVHTWGVGCDVDGLRRIADDHGLVLMFDAAHAFGCTHEGRPFGSNGTAEVFSLHATKYVNAFEGGVITTNDADLAERIRYMVNFGFAGIDKVVSVGTNAKMTEVCAAMALTSIESQEQFAQHNRRIWDTYDLHLKDVKGVDLLEYPTDEINSHQYVVAEVTQDCAASRDRIVEVLHAENCIARRYFYPGVHRMEPYASLQPMSHRWLHNTEALTERVLILPSGTAISPEVAERVAQLIKQTVVTCA